MGKVFVSNNLLYLFIKCHKCTILMQVVNNRKHWLCNIWEYVGIF